MLKLNSLKLNHVTGKVNTFPPPYICHSLLQLKNVLVYLTSNNDHHIHAPVKQTKLEHSAT